MSSSSSISSSSLSSLTLTSASLLSCSSSSLSSPSSTVALDVLSSSTPSSFASSLSQHSASVLLSSPLLGSGPFLPPQTSDSDLFSLLPPIEPQSPSEFSESSSSLGEEIIDCLKRIPSYCIGYQSPSVRKYVIDHFTLNAKESEIFVENEDVLKRFLHEQHPYSLKLILDNFKRGFFPDFLQEPAYRSFLKAFGPRVTNLSFYISYYGRHSDKMTQEIYDIISCFVNLKKLTIDFGEGSSSIKELVINNTNLEELVIHVLEDNPQTINLVSKKLREVVIGIEEYCETSIDIKHPAFEFTVSRESENFSSFKTTRKQKNVKARYYDYEYVLSADAVVQFMMGECVGISLIPLGNDESSNALSSPQVESRKHPREDEFENAETSRRRVID